YRAAGSPRSVGVTPLRCYYGPVRHPLAFDRLPGLVGYTIYLTPMISHRDQRGFTRYPACACHRDGTYAPPRWATASVRFRHPMLPSPCSGGLGPRILLFRGHICVYCRYCPVTRYLPNRDLVVGIAGLLT